MKLNIFLAIMFSATIANAAPSITSTSGAVKHNESIVITGSGFGAKSTASPRIYDEMERSPLTTSANVGTWSSIYQNDTSNTQLRHQYSTYAGHHNFTDYGQIGFEGGGAVSQKWFVSYWIYFDNNFDWGVGQYGSDSQMLSNIKFPVRFWKGSGQPNIYNSLGWGLDDAPYNNVEYAGTGAAFTGITKNSITKGQWHQIQQEFVDSATGTGADCQWRLWWDGQKIYDRSNFVCNTNTDYRSPLFVGFYNAWGPPASSAPNDAYIDDIYVDATLQRVEICNNSVRSSATHCEVQLPTEWSDTSISATVKKGSIGDSGYYLFVFDADGAVSNGYAISTDSTPPTTTPSKQGRFTASQTVTLSANETATTVYCRSTSSNCTPATSYSTAIKTLVNVPYEKICYKSTDSASNAEGVKCTEFFKKRRK